MLVYLWVGAVVHSQLLLRRLPRSDEALKSIPAAKRLRSRRSLESSRDIGHWRHAEQGFNYGAVYQVPPKQH